MKTKDNEFSVGDKVWFTSQKEVCIVISIQPAIYLNGEKLVNQYVMVQYGNDPKDTSGWINSREFERL